MVRDLNYVGFYNIFVYKKSNTSLYTRNLNLLNAIALIKLYYQYLLANKSYLISQLN